MKDYKIDFPIFQNNTGLVYLDSTATSQKPKLVIDWITNYLENDYANIHRWSYDLSARSEELYKASKEKTKEMIWAKSWREIIYTLNSTYASNLLISSLKRSWYIQKWDKILLSIVEHHANIVPWLILKEEIGVEIEYINIRDDYSLDMEDLKNKLDDRVKVISLTHVSNVTWEIFDFREVVEVLEVLYPDNCRDIPNTGYLYGNPPKPLYQGEKRPFLIIDASQSIPHFEVNVKKLGCDFLFFTGHKVMADSGIWVLWGREELLGEMRPAFSGGGAIREVAKDCFVEAPLPDRFEPGTPNLTGAVSLLRAFEYIEKIWWYATIEKIEKELINHTIQKFEEFEKKWVKLIWSKNSEKRVGVFSFTVEWIHSIDISDYLSDHDICIRAGQHCAEPLMKYLWVEHTARMSLYLYNTLDDIDKFFEVLDNAILELKK